MQILYDSSSDILHNRISMKENAHVCIARFPHHIYFGNFL